MKRCLLLVPLLSFLIALTLPFGVNAADAPAIADECDCWCSSDQGAFSIGNVPSGACGKECFANSNRSQAIVCATSPTQFPERNLQCFSKAKDVDLCKRLKGTLSAEQAPICPPGYTYCYPDPTQAIKTKLNVPLPGITTVGDFGIYISAIYMFLLGASVSIAIVMVLVGGFQYVLGAGSAEQLSKGKERIKLAVIGLVLLLSAVLIFQTVSPATLNLAPPQFPIIKPVAFSTGNSCEDLERQEKIFTGPPSITYEGTGKICGVVAELKQDRNGAAFPEGQTCMFNKCPDRSFKACVPFAKGSEADANARGGKIATCLTCDEIVPGNSYGIIPTPEVCALFASVSGQAGKEQVYDCIFTKDADALDTLPSLQSGVGTCALLTTAPGTLQYVDCSKIDECGDYDDQITVYANGTDNDNLEKFDDLGRVCTQDVCGVARKAQESGKGPVRCGYYPPTTVAGIENVTSGDCKNTIQ